MDSSIITRGDSAGYVGTPEVGGDTDALFFGCCGSPARKRAPECTQVCTQNIWYHFSPSALGGGRTVTGKKAAITGKSRSDGPTQMERFAKIVQRSLREMDAIADAKILGSRAGLCNYAAFRQLNHVERAWSLGLAEHLTKAGFPSDTEVSYPTQPRKKCDVVAELPHKERVWVEVKPAWRCWYAEGRQKWNSMGIYRSYLLGPLEPGLSRSHSAAQDFDKLETLISGRGQYLGVVLIGFDEFGGPLTSDVDELVRRKRLVEKGWHSLGPRGARPRSRVMLVLVQVSSTKIRRAAARLG